MNASVCSQKTTSSVVNDRRLFEMYHANNCYVMNNNKAGDRRDLQLTLSNFMSQYTASIKLQTRLRDKVPATLTNLLVLTYSYLEMTTTCLEMLEDEKDKSASWVFHLDIEKKCCCIRYSPQTSRVVEIMADTKSFSAEVFAVSTHPQ